MFSIAYWSFLLATGCYISLAAWRSFITRTHPSGHYLAIAFAGMAIWCVASLLEAPVAFIIGEAIRDLGWLAYFYYSTRSKDGDDQVRLSLALSCVLLAILTVIRTIISSLVISDIFGDIDSHSVALFTIAVRWLFAASGLFFINFIYRTTILSAGSGFRLVIIALGVIWAYDLNLFTLILLGYPQAILLSGLRGTLSLMLVPAFALGARRKERWKITPSRQATTQSLLLLAVGGYFVVVASATRAAVWAGDTAGDALKIIIAIALTSTVLALVFMPRLRAHTKTFLIKHLFEHRYDYRSEWLRFSATIADRGASLLSTEERAIRSLADVTEALGGALFLLEPVNRLMLAGTWQLALPDFGTQSRVIDPQWVSDLTETGRILKFDDIRKSNNPPTVDANVPIWLVENEDFWIAIPLIRSQRFIGLAVLARPLINRDLDWEDFDLLKVVAQQVAVHISDEQSHAELQDARRFDEFNRRFAFIVHDLKNVVSQLSLVSSNAAEHGANPKFQASMVKTLSNATAKMTTLLSRLTPDRMGAEPVLTDLAPGQLLERLARETTSASPLIVEADCPCTIRADEERLLEALGHLLSNAIEANPEGKSVKLRAEIQDDMAIMSVEDYGCGMSANFIRKELYKPFSSTKEGGFGIGAAEARAMILAMGGVLDVFSIEGEGTKFSAIFPIRQMLHNSRT